MFALNLRYTKSAGDMKEDMAEHIAYLDEYRYVKRVFHMGQANAGTKQTILCHTNNLDEIKEFISNDPLFIKGLAKYEIIEFTAEGYKVLLTDGKQV